MLASSSVRRQSIGKCVPWPRVLKQLQLAAVQLQLTAVQFQLTAVQLSCGSHHALQQRSARWGWWEEDPLPYIMPGVGFSRNTIWEYHTFGDFSVIYLRTWSRLVLIFVGYKMCLTKTPYLVISKREQPKLDLQYKDARDLFFLVEFVMKDAWFLSYLIHIKYSQRPWDHRKRTEWLNF